MMIPLYQHNSDQCSAAVPLTQLGQGQC